jgi:hypothetical protein
MRKTLALIFVIIIFLVLIFCNEDVNSTYPGQDTPSKTIDSLKYSFLNYNSSTAIKILGQIMDENFRFYFDPEEYEVPVLWDKNTFVASTDNMFKSIQHLDLDFTPDPGESDLGWEGETPFECELEINFLIMLSDIQAYQATGLVGFVMVEEGGLWYIDEMSDHTSIEDVGLDTSIVSTSLGKILYMFFTQIDSS